MENGEWRDVNEVENMDVRACWSWWSSYLGRLEDLVVAVDDEEHGEEDRDGHKHDEDDDEEQPDGRRHRVNLRQRRNRTGRRVVEDGEGRYA